MNRNTNYIVQIIIWGVVGVIATGILISAIVVGSFSEIINKAFDWSEKGMEIVEERSFDSKGIENINVEWFDGTINIYPWDEDEIKIIEKKKGKIRKIDILKVSVKDQTLSIKQEKKRRIFTIVSFGINNIARDIIVPEKLYQKISVKGTSGKLTIKDLEADKFDLKLTSGKIETNNLSGSDLTTKLTSGAMDMVGEFENLDADVTSGSINLDLNKAPSKMMVKLTSGKAIISIPENDGFTLFETKSSGSFKNEFQVDDFGVYKNGENKYSIKLSSGLVKLLKK